MKGRALDLAGGLAHVYWQLSVIKGLAKCPREASEDVVCMAAVNSSCSIGVLDLGTLVCVASPMGHSAEDF
jgi:hypothetical protein